MRVLRLAILTMAVSFSVIGAAWANGDLADADLNGTPVPEPGSLVLLLTGIGAGAAAFFRRRK